MISYWQGLVVKTHREVIPMPRAFTSGARDLAWNVSQPRIIKHYAPDSSLG